MAKKDNRIDQYIAKAQPFAQPILTHLRKLVQKTCPEMEEKIKWGIPFFDYHGSQLCQMAAFKEHAGFGFWKAALLKDPNKYFQTQEGMGQFGRLQSLKDLPPDKILVDFIKQAIKLNESGMKVERKVEKKEIVVDPPDYFLKALKQNKAALKTFEAFSPSNKRDYIVWVTEAKTEATGEKRLATAIEWMAEGKTRLWKYQQK